MAALSQAALGAQGILNRQIVPSSACSDGSGAEGCNTLSIRSQRNLASAASLKGNSVSVHPKQEKTVARPKPGLFVRADNVRTEQKVRVVLGPYKDGALKASVPAPKVTEEEIEKALKAKSDKKYVLERINFTGSGAKLGHTVRLRFEGRLVEGPNAGQPIKGTKADNYELELKERDDEPWKTIVREIISKGMGQEETKSFIVQFPEDFKAKPLAGVKAQFTVTVKEIGVRKEVAVDSGSLEEQRAAVEAELRTAAERRASEAIDLQLRDALLESSEADVEKMAASVTWAKFGEKSLRDYKWNVVQEEVARVEGIPFDEVPAYLRSQAEVTHS